MRGLNWMQLTCQSVTSLAKEEEQGKCRFATQLMQIVSRQRDVITKEFNARGTVIIALAASLAVSMAGAQSSRRLDCVSPFSETATFSSLAQHFGAQNVVNNQIYLGEALYETGTIIFPTSDTDRIEVLWKDAEARRFPRSVRIRGDNSNWRTASGVSLATELRAIERINRRPFRLAGFGWDYGGTQLSWSGGLMESEATGPCRVRARLSPQHTPGDAVLFRQVLGEREFSSGHPAMQELNPRVYDLWLEY